MVSTSSNYLLKFNFGLASALVPVSSNVSWEQQI